jgi:hypothetical protein
MTKKIKGDLILIEDTTFNEDLVVEGDIKGLFNLKVARNIKAWNIEALNIEARNIKAWNIEARNIEARNIKAWNIEALNIEARNIKAWNIDAFNIDAWNINAGNIEALNIDALNIIFCDKIKIKEGCKVNCRVLITDKFNLEIKEWKV